MWAPSATEPEWSWPTSYQNTKRINSILLSKAVNQEFYFTKTVLLWLNILKIFNFYRKHLGLSNTSILNSFLNLPIF